MINALVSGKLVADPIAKTSASGKSYVRLLVSAPTSASDSILVTALCFNSDADALMALSRGDPVSFAGSATPTAWVKDGSPRAGLNLMVNGALSLRDAKRKRAPRTAPTGAAPALAGTDDFLEQAGKWDDAL